VDDARRLADDLAFMIEKGGKLADRLEKGVTGAIKTADAPAAAPAPARAGRPPEDDTPEARLLRSLDRVR
jgi:hypothetical protein